MSGIFQDLRYALRGLRKNPAFTMVAVLTLALGIGANTAMFTVMSAVLLRPLPYPSPEQLAMLWTERPDQNLREGRSSYFDVEQWRSQSKSVADMAVFDGATVNLTGGGESERISSVRISPNFFPMLGIQPLRGRTFSTEEAERRDRVVVISHRFWQSRFAGGENAIGKTIEIDGVPSEVIGILPPRDLFAGVNADVWEPHTLIPDWEVNRSQRGGSSWLVIGRLRPNVTLDQAQLELSTIASRLDQTRPASQQGRGISLVPLSLHLVGARTRLALWMLTGAVFCVLLIGVTNITSLSLARSASRQREMALRTALGASLGRLFRQLFTESLTLAMLSGLAGVLVAALCVPLILSLKPANLVLPDAIGLDTRMLGWTLGLSVLTGMLVGLAPAAVTGRWNPRPALQDGGKGGSAGTFARMTRRGLVMMEFALAIVLLVGAGLLTRSLLHVQSVDPGFRTDDVLSMQLSLPPVQGAGQRVNYYQQVLQATEAVRGVERAGVIGDLFIGGIPEQLVTVEGSTRSVPDRVRLRRDEVSDGFFATLQIPLRRGRLFSSEDGPDSPRVAIINETMARRLWPGQDSIGRRFRIGPQVSEDAWFTVVGMVGDMRRQNLENEPVAQMFEPLAQNPSRLATLVVRTSTDPLGMAATIRTAIRQVDGRMPVYGVTTLASRLQTFQAERRFQTSLLLAFSMVALLLAAIGIYGVVQYSVATRTREIGVRMAVGAQRGDVFRMVLGEGLKLSLTGLALGLVGALWLGHIGSSLLFDVSPADPITYAAVSLLLTAVALAGCYFPARRAARLDPLVALRYE
ncbi:MAG: ABC transporter permease [Acidobacteria bacterium]|nr:MAG: ABC transporter permease [Acidobacteriota bacterium]